MQQKKVDEHKTQKFRGETDAERAAIQQEREAGTYEEGDTDDVAIGTKPAEEVVDAAEAAAEAEKAAKRAADVGSKLREQEAAEQNDAVEVLVDERRRRQDRRNKGEPAFVEDAEEGE